MKRAIVVGAGGYGQMMSDYLAGAGYSVAGFLDDAESLRGKSICGIPVLGRIATLEEMVGRADAVFVALGANAVRRSILKTAQSMGFAIPAFVHSAACVADQAEVDEGVYVLQGAQVMPFAKLGFGSVVSMAANVAHHSVLGDGAFLSTGVNLGANVRVGLEAFLGIGSTVMTGVKRIGDRAIVGAGAVVIDDVDSGSTVVGVPARPIRRNLV